MPAAMPRAITYYFSMVSPWAYIGQPLFAELAKRHALKVIYRPVFLGDLFAESGGLPLAKRHPLRLRYRWFELQRWREKRGLSFELQPKHWPFDVKLADGVVVALCEAGKDPGEFMLRGFRASWEQSLDLADASTLSRLLEDSGFASAPVLAAAQGAAAQAIYVANQRKALADGVFGSPAWVLDGEVFWGQDRIELLDDALKSGREAFPPPP